MGYYKVLVDLLDCDGDLSKDNVQAEHVPDSRLCMEMQRCLDGFRGTPDVKLVQIRIVPQWG
jgi:hypothetical protein